MYISAGTTVTHAHTHTRTHTHTHAHTHSMADPRKCLYRWKLCCTPTVLVALSTSIVNDAISSRQNHWCPEWPYSVHIFACRQTDRGTDGQMHLAGCTLPAHECICMHVEKLSTVHVHVLHTVSTHVHRPKTQTRAYVHRYIHTHTDLRSWQHPSVAGTAALGVQYQLDHCLLPQQNFQSQDTLWPGLLQWQQFLYHHCCMIYTKEGGPRHRYS